jgi:hypothetical protein
MRKAGTFTPLGALTTRIAARLMARREAEIRSITGEKDDRPGNQVCVGRIADAKRGTKTGPLGRLNKDAASTRGKVGVQSVGEDSLHASNVIELAAVWGGREAAGTARLRPARRVVPADQASNSAKIHFAFLGVPSQVMHQPCASATSSKYAIGSPSRADTSSA